MLGRKVSVSSVPGSAAGLDRSRIGERLQAALAGLQELHHLRDKQSGRVHWALTLNGEESDTSKHHHVNTEELKLEATLSLLKQQLTRLRKQDMGLKNHLQQLDQQISELKLDVCKASTEHLESDSRPSSGFFELSDGGSGSLSNSCTSVYSESLSSSSQTNFPPFLSISYGPHGCSGSGQSTVSRCCSADESTTQSDVPRPLGVKLGSSCIRMVPASAVRARQRPVSTGDLDRITTPGMGSFRSTEIKTSTLCGTLNKPSVDLKYQSNLVSSNGTEVYCYPSPLHAVALQSPIFSLTGDQGCQVVAEEQDGKVGLQEITHNFNQGSINLRSAGYINKLLQRSSSKINLLNDIKRNDPYTALKQTQEQRPRSQELTYGHPQLLGSLQQLMLPDTEKTSTALNKDQQKINVESNSSHPAPSKELQQNCNSLSSVITKTSAVSVNCFSDKGSGHSFESSSMVSEERRSSTLRGDKDRILRTDKGGTPQSEEFVHAEFVPAGSQRVKVRQGDKRTKSVKLKRKSSEKPSAKKQQQKLLSREKDFCKTQTDVKQSSSCKGKMTSLEEIHMYSSSDGSRNGLVNLHCTQNKPHQTSKSRKAHYPEPVHIPLDQPRKKQSSRKWPSASEVQLAPFHGQRSKEMLASRKTGMVRSISARPRSGQWGCPQRTLRQSLSTSSYLSYLESRYPPAPNSGRNPPRCESEFSEYSAECASLFHSTIAASSDGEMSDYTTNRFGDSESSQGSQTASDSDSSLSVDEEDLLEEEEENEVGLVWAQAAMGPTAAGFSLQEQQRSESAACRIKASRALKKKIRRFQPASLKVMTLV